MLFIAKNTLAGIYTNQADVALLTTGLLVWVALYHLADAVQLLCIFVLRCYRITLAPLLIYGCMLWGVGLGGGYWLAYQFPAEAGPAARALAASSLVGTALGLLLFRERDRR